MVCLPNIGLNEEELIYLVYKYVSSWTEIPLSICDGYDIEQLRFYDAFLGTLIRNTEEFLRNYPGYENDGFIRSWKYQGKLYRLLHEAPHIDRRYLDGYRLELPSVEYHRMVSHWTDDYSFKGLMYKLSPQTQYIILEADTNDHLAFDIYGFLNKYGFRIPKTENEREFIFPMYKECITEYRMTVEEFVGKKLKDENSFQ